jgi:hypothetical protein
VGGKRGRRGAFIRRLKVSNIEVCELIILLPTKEERING